MVNVGKYTIHGCHGDPLKHDTSVLVFYSDVDPGNNKSTGKYTKTPTQKKTNGWNPQDEGLEDEF